MITHVTSSRLQALSAAIRVSVSPEVEAAAAVATAVWSDSSLKVYFNCASAVDGSIVESSTRVNICSDDTVGTLIEKLRRKNLFNSGDDLILNLEGPIPGPVPSDLMICAVLSNLKEQGFDTKTKFRVFSPPRSSRGPLPPLPPHPSSGIPAEKASAAADDANATANAALAAQAAVTEAAVAAAAVAAAEAAAAAAAAAAVAEAAAAAEAAAVAAVREAAMKQRQEEERQEMQRQQQLLLQKQQQELAAQRAQEEAVRQAELQARLKAEADAAQRAVIEAAEQARLLKLQEEEASQLRQQKLEEEQKLAEEVVQRVECRLVYFRESAAFSEFFSSLFELFQGFWSKLAIFAILPFCL